MCYLIKYFDQKKKKKKRKKNTFSNFLWTLSSELLEIQVLLSDFIRPRKKSLFPVMVWK